MPPGVSVGVNVNAQQAQRGLAGLQQGFGKLASSTKSLFGGSNSQQLNTYNKHLNQLERNLDRVNTRLKTLQGVQSSLLTQQRQLQQSGGAGGAAQLATVQKALQQNTRALSFWQAKQAGAQAAVSYQQGQRPAVGGGGGGMAGFFAGQFNNVAGGLGGTILKAVGIGAVTKGVAEVISKSFLTALDEQKLLADMLPRMRLGDSLRNASPKGYMNNLRDMTMPLGFSGVEGLKVASAMSSGSSDRGLFGDTKTAMQMSRMFGIDAGGQAGMLAEGGKMGAFVPGQAKRFAEMLARQIKVEGLGPRAQEVQEATLSLLHRQIDATGSTSAAAAMTQQIMLAKTGVPGLQGQFGANVLAGANAHIQGATDDASVAFQEATLRDQRGVRGYYSLRRFKEQVASDPTAIRDVIREAYQLTQNDDQAKDLISRQTGIPMTLLDSMGKGTKGGLRNIGSNNIGIMRALKASGGMLDKGAAAAMGLPGNQFREAEATVSGTMGRMGTPIVQMAGTLAQKASEQIIGIMKVFDENKKSNAHLGKIENSVAQMAQKISPTFPTNQSVQQKAAFKKKYGMNPEDAHYDLNGNPVNGIGQPLTPMGGGIGLPANDAVARLRKKYGPPVLPPGPNGISPAPIDGHSLSIQKRSDAGDKLHIHVSFDHSGNIHPHAKLAFIGHVEEAVNEIQRRKTRGNLHQRYPRV
jgi:hypothetical protein